MSTLHSIGNVGFAHAVTAVDKAAYKARFQRKMPDHVTLVGDSIMGNKRRDLLRAAFRGDVLPGGLVLVVNHPSGPHNEPITRCDVRWDIEGEGSSYGRVTDGIWEPIR